MKETVTFTIDAALLNKIENLQIKRGTNRSEMIRHILNEFFNSGTNFTDLVYELERLKGQNVELKYQLEKLTKSFKTHAKEVVAMLLLIGGKDEMFQKEIMKRLPHYWPKE